jgi:uncharacterized membrane protein
LLSFEIWDDVGYSGRAIGSGSSKESLLSAQLLSLTTIWATYAVILLIVGFTRRWRQVRLWGLALLAAAIIKLFVYDVFTLQLLYRIIAFAALGLLLLIGGYLYQRYSKNFKGFIAK